MPQLDVDVQINLSNSDARVKGNEVEKASGLLNASEAAAEARWAALTDTDLDDEIAAYRQGVRDISKELESLGVAVSIDEAQPEAPAAPDDAEVTEQLRSCRARGCTRSDVC